MQNLYYKANEQSVQCLPFKAIYSAVQISEFK